MASLDGRRGVKYIRTDIRDFVGKMLHLGQEPITDLHVSGDLSSEPAMTAVVDLLGASTTMTGLDLGGTRISTAGAHQIAAGMFELGDRQAPLKFLNLHQNARIDMSGIEALVRAAASHPTLASLELSGCRVGNEGANALAQAMASSTSLVSLGLQKCGIRRSGALALAAIAMKRPVQFINLSMNPIGDYAAASLLEAISTCPAVDVASLRCVHGGDKMAVSLARCLGPDSKCKLKAVIIGNNSIGPIGIDALSHAIARSDRLSHLNCMCIVRTLQSYKQLEAAVQAVRQRRQLVARTTFVPNQAGGYTRSHLEGFSSWRQRAIVLHRRAHEAKRDTRRMGRAAAEGRPLELGKRARLGVLGGGLKVKTAVCADRSMQSLLGVAGSQALQRDALCAACLGGHADCVGVLLDAMDGAWGMLGALREGAWSVYGVAGAVSGFSCVGLCARLVGVDGYEDVCLRVGSWMGRVRGMLDGLTDACVGVCDRAVQLERRMDRRREAMGADAAAKEQAELEELETEAAAYMEEGEGEGAVDLWQPICSGGDYWYYKWQLVFDTYWEWSDLLGKRLRAEQAEEEAEYAVLEAVRAWEGVREGLEGLKRVLVEQRGSDAGGGVGSAEGTVGLAELVLGRGDGAGLLGCAVDGVRRHVLGEGVDWGRVCDEAMVDRWAVGADVDVLVVVREVMGGIKAYGGGQGDGSDESDGEAGSEHSSDS